MSVTSRGAFPSRLVMLLLLGAACGRPCNEGSSFDLCIFETSFANEDLYSDRELFGKYENEYRSRDQEHDKVRRSESDPDTEDHKNTTDDDSDVVDREDHVTQYLSELLVNTDSEITSLQASDVEDDKEEPSAYFSKEDLYFAFLTGQENVIEVDSALSIPAKSAIEESEMHNSGI